ncbi:recombination protein O N-terminal domain-containing protein [Tenacibaculum sp. SG-28]
MAIVTTKALVFNAIKYSDSSLIVKCFTFEDGLRSYLIRGILKSKKGN